MPVTAPAFASPLPGTPRYTVHPSPVGDLLLVGDGRSLNGLYMLPDHRYGPTVGAHWRLDPAFFAETGRQLDDYFAGRLVSFDLPLAPRGSDFQCAVWRELTAIEHGRVTSYGAVAAALGRPTAARAVGAANGRNPISIIVPCHRVVGADGSLTGYGGGLERKQALLDLERRAPVHPGKTGPSARRRVVDQVGVASHDHRVPHREQQR